jgi:hypothetical protein
MRCQKSVVKPIIAAHGAQVKESSDNGDKNQDQRYNSYTGHQRALKERLPTAWLHNTTIPPPMGFLVGARIVHCTASARYGGWIDDCGGNCGWQTQRFSWLHYPPGVTTLVRSYVSCICQVRTSYSENLVLIGSGSYVPA